MATTTNYGWTTPDDTALVKDGAAAIRTLGSSVDSTLKTQVDNTVASSIQKSVITTTGDVIYASGANTPARLGIGTTGQVLTVSGGLPTWATSASGGFTQLATGTLSTTSVNISGISGSYRDLYLYVQNYYGTGTDNVNYTFNSSATGYSYARLKSAYVEINNNTAIGVQIPKPSPSANGIAVELLVINNYASTASGKLYTLNSLTNTASDQHGVFIGGWNGTAAITSIQLATASAFSGGTYTLLGLK